MGRDRVVRNAADGPHPRRLVQRALHDRRDVAAVAEVDHADQQAAHHRQDQGELDDRRSAGVAPKRVEEGTPAHWVSLRAPMLLPIWRKRAMSAVRSEIVDAWLALLAQ